MRALGFFVLLLAATASSVTGIAPINWPDHTAPCSVTIPATAELSDEINAYLSSYSGGSEDVIVCLEDFDGYTGCQPFDYTSAGGGNVAIVGKSNTVVVCDDKRFMSKSTEGTNVVIAQVEFQSPDFLFYIEAGNFKLVDVTVVDSDSLDVYGFSGGRSERSTVQDTNTITFGSISSNTNIDHKESESDETAARAEARADTPKYNSAIEVIGATVFLENCVFMYSYEGSDVNGVAVNSDSGSYLNVTNTQFSYAWGKDGGAIYMIDTEAHFLAGTRFEGCKGSSGGAVYADSSVVTVDDTTFDHNYVYNKGGALFVLSGSLTVTNSVFASNDAATILATGGAVYINDCPATFINTYFAGNSAALGGAVRVTGASGPTLLQLTACTFLDNDAGTGGDVYASSNYIVVVERSSFSSSGASYSVSGGGGSIRSLSGVTSLTISNSTFTSCAAPASKGGAIRASAATIVDTVFADNSADDGGALSSSGGAPGLLMTNCTLSGNSAGNDGGAIHLDSPSPSDASPAVLTDCTFTSNSAVARAGGLYAGYAVGVIDCEFTSNGLGSSGTYGGGVFVQFGVGNVVLRSNFTNNYAQASGGGLCSFATLTYVTDCVFTRNTASSTGGAAIADGGSWVEASGCEFVDNYSGSSGGAVALYATLYMSVVSSTFTNNYAVGQGGGFGFDGASTYVTLSDCVFDSNTGAGGGGGLAGDGEANATALVTDCTFNNSRGSSGGGGAVFMSGVGTATLTRVSILNGYAVQGGGAKFVGGSATLTDSWLVNNDARNNGGGLAVEGGGNVELFNTSVGWNTAGGEGGGVVVSGAGVFTATESPIYNCTAALGGGLAADLASATVVNSVVSGNVASDVGGGARCLSAVCSFVDVSLTDNSASLGGAVFAMFTGASLSVTGSVVTRNTDGLTVYIGTQLTVTATSILDNEGVAIETSSATVSLLETVVSGNTADAALSITSAPSVAIAACFVAENVGTGLLCADAHIDFTGSVVCNSGATNVACNSGCSVSDSAGVLACGDVNGTACLGICDTLGSGFCVETHGVYSGPYGGCNSCDGACYNGDNDCHTNARCTDLPNYSYSCSCKAGYSGDGVTNCTDIDECAGAAAGECVLPAVCVNTPGSWYCGCVPGYAAVKGVCGDIDECALGTDNCAANATCTNTDGSFTCACNNGFYGDNGTVCTACPPHMTTEFAGSTQLDDCECESGFFLEDLELLAAGCTACPAGSYLWTPLVCELCPSDTYSRLPNSDNCTACPANSHTVGPGTADVANCTCEDGFFAAFLGDDCQRWCDAGFERPTYAAQCTACGSGSYAPEPNQAACTLCPPNNLSPQQATSKGQCKCRPGYYTPQEKSGTECLSCPEGGICDGGTAQPRAGYGFAPEKGGDDSASFVACVPEESCLGDGQCGKGYDGTLCASCSPGFYLLGGRCHPCGRSPWSVFFAAFLALLIACCFVIWFNSSDRAVNRFSSVVIGINSLQVAAQYGQLELNWPPLARAFFDVLSVANLNVELVAPECAVLTDNAFLLRWTITMLMPLILVIMFALIYANIMMYNTIVEESGLLQYLGLRDHGGLPTPEFGSEPWHSLFAADPHTVSSTLIHTCQRAFYQLMTLAYLPLSAMVFGFFDCVDNGAGLYVMAYSRATTCYDKPWFSVLPFALLFVLMYPIGMPAFYFALLRYKRASLGEMKFAIRYGFLVGRYQDRYYNFELTVMARKLGVVLAMSFFTKSPYIQAGGAIIVLLIALTHHTWTFPFTKTVYNAIEGFCIACAIVVLLLGIMLVDGAFSDGLRNGAIFTVIIASLLAILLAFAYDIVQLRAEEKETSANHRYGTSWNVSRRPGAFRGAGPGAGGDDGEGCGASGDDDSGVEMAGVGGTAGAAGVFAVAPNPEGQEQPRTVAAVSVREDHMSSATGASEMSASVDDTSGAGDETSDGTAAADSHAHAYNGDEKEVAYPSDRWGHDTVASLESTELPPPLNTVTELNNNNNIQDPVGKPTSDREPSLFNSYGYDPGLDGSNYPHGEPVVATADHAHQQAEGKRPSVLNSYGYDPESRGTRDGGGGESGVAAADLPPPVGNFLALPGQAGGGASGDARVDSAVAALSIDVTQGDEASDDGLL